MKSFHILYISISGSFKIRWLPNTVYQKLIFFCKSFSRNLASKNLRIRYCEWNLKLVIWLFPRSLAATTTSSSWSPLPRPSAKSNWKFSATLGREKQRWSSPLKPDTSLDFSGGAKSLLHLSKTIHPGILTNTECCYICAIQSAIAIHIFPALRK